MREYLRSLTADQRWSISCWGLTMVTIFLLILGTAIIADVFNLARVCT